MSNVSDHVLECRNVTWGYADRLVGTIPSWDVPSGVLTGVIGGHGEQVAELFDVVEGLICPVSGTVRFGGVDWQEMMPAEGDRCRATIGRTFSGRAWMSNLTLMENLLLAPTFHGGRTRQEVLREIEELTHVVGVAEVPRMRPHELGAVESHLLQWVRAFLGRRRLVLLEHPTTGVSSEHGRGLVTLVQRAMAAGTAVVWAVSREEDWSALGVSPTCRLLWRGGRWMTGEGT